MLGCSTALVPAAYRANMVNPDAPTSGTVSGALKTVENYLIQGKQNQALMQLRNIGDRVAGMMLPPDRSAVITAPQTQLQPTSTPIPTPSPTPTPAQTSTPTPNPTPPSAPAASSVPSSTVQGGPATLTTGGTTTVQTDLSSARTVTVFAYQAYTEALFASLKREIDTRLAAPFNMIDDVWSRDPADCVTQYRAQLDLCVQWVKYYQKLFASSDWQPLSNYFYANVISASNAMLNPLKVSILGSGIRGSAYASVYDTVHSALGAIKNVIQVRESDISSIQQKVLSGKASYASTSGGSLFSW